MLLSVKPYLVQRNTFAVLRFDIQHLGFFTENGSPLFAADIAL